MNLRWLATPWRRAVLAAAYCAASASAAEFPAAVNVFVGGQEGPAGTSNYRIPGLIVAPDGSLLAFAEGRRNGSDPGAGGYPIDMVAKRSADGGATWGPLVVLNANPAFDYSDPRPIADAETGAVHLLYAQWPDNCGQSCVPGGLGDGSSVVLLQSTFDGGATWTAPANINVQVKDPSWRALNPGPGSGIQLRWQSDPARNGRLLAPAHRDDGQGFDAVSLYSDDGGVTWGHGSASAGVSVNESEVVELVNGDLLWDGRTFSGATRQQFLSVDGGSSWAPLGPGDLPVTRVDTSLIRWTAQRDGDDRNRLLYAAPLGDPAGAGNSRLNMGVWTSYDEGKSFINPVQLAEGHAAYSVLQRLDDRSAGLLFEATGSTQIQFLRFEVAHVEGAEHSAALTHYDGFGNQIDPLRGGVGWTGAWQGENVEIRSGALEFAGFFTQGDVQHARLRDGILLRNLGQAPLDLAASQDFYLSLFVQHSSTDGSVGGDEAFSVLLQDSRGATHAAFGIDDQDAFFVRELGDPAASEAGVLERDRTYLLLAKLSAAEGGVADQLQLAWYDDPLSVPADESEVAWRLAGSAAESSSALLTQIQLVGGADADWLVDGLRIGTQWDAVIVDNSVQLPPVPGDLNGDQRIDLSDWLVFRGRVSADTSALGGDDQVRQGDFDRSGQIDLADFLEFRRLFDAAQGPGAFSAATMVPEPTVAAWTLWLVAWTSWARRARKSR